MIAVATAKKIITDNCITLPVVQTALQDSLQSRLAADIFSPVDVPAYPQSSMDGYAFAYADWQQQKKLILFSSLIGDHWHFRERCRKKMAVILLKERKKFQLTLFVFFI